MKKFKEWKMEENELLRKWFVFCVLAVMGVCFSLSSVMAADVYGAGTKWQEADVLAVTASAAKQLSVNSPLKTTSDSNGNILVKFTPTETNIYQFDMEGEEYGRVTDPVTNISDLDTSRYNSLDGYHICFKAGNTYYFQFNCYSVGEKNVTISVKKYSGGSWSKGFSWKIDEMGTLTISGTGAMPSYQEAYHYPWYDFQELPVIKTVVISPGITTVAKEVFYSFKSITNVVLPEGLVTIGASSFWGCKITTLKLPSTVTTVGTCAFADCNINRLTMCEGLKEIKSRAFSTNPITSLTFPSTLKTIGSYAFESTNIKKLTIPATIKTGLNAFFECNQLTTVTFAAGTQTIGNGVCNYCKKLKTIKMPSTVKTIGRQAFGGTAITSVTIPKNVTSIKSYAFENCLKLKKIKIPKKVKKIGNYAFGYKDGLVKPVRMKKFVIKGVKKSAAQKYAKKNAITFKIVKK